MLRVVAPLLATENVPPVEKPLTTTSAPTEDDVTMPVNAVAGALQKAQQGIQIMGFKRTTNMSASHRSGTLGFQMFHNLSTEQDSS